MTEKYSLSKNQIIDNYQNVIQQICISILSRNNEHHLINDLVQEINLILLNQLDEAIQSLYETNQLRYFIARITTNQVLSNTSPFHKKYRDRGLKDAPIYDSYDDSADKIWEEASKIDHKFTKDIIILRYEYDLKIAEIADLKGVSERYVYKILSKSQKFLKKKFDN